MSGKNNVLREIEQQMRTRNKQCSTYCMRKTYYMDGGKMEQKSSRTNYRKKTEKKTDKHLSVIIQQINGDYFCNQKKQIDSLD